MPMSNFSANKILDAVFSAASLSAPATFYVRLYTAAPTASGGGTEVSGGSYAPLSKTNNSTNFPAASSQTKTSGTDWDFGTATADWGTVTSWGLWDASSGGNLWFFGSLSTARLVLNGDPFKIPSGSASFVGVTT